MEMLIAVSLLVVLLSISIVSITSWTKSIKMAELDNYAKTIYLEAQNQLAALEVEGALSKLNYDLSDENGAYYAQYQARKLTEKPADYDEDTYGSYYQNLYYFSSKDEIVSLFVPEISLSDENGTYVLELNPATGDIYGVFYWENTNEMIPHTSVEAYTVIQEMVVKDSDTHNRQKNSRSAYEVGYYGADASGEILFNEAYQLNQKVEIVNGDELYVKISYDYNQRVIEHVNNVNNKPFEVEISIIGETSGKTWTPAFDIKDNYHLNGNRLETGLLLDGIGVGQDFKSITAGTGFIPGENLFITVKTVYQYNSVKLKEQSTTLKTNSLFDKVSEIPETGERKVRVSTIRHLLNLGYDRSGNYLADAIAGNELEELSITLTKNIDFAGGAYVFNGRSYTVEQQSGDGYVSLSRPVMAVTPIQNDVIFENAPFKTIVDGDDYAIQNLVVNANTANAGLFAKAIAVEFKNIKLEDYTLNASGQENVGALVGEISGGSIENCGVYLSPFYRDASGAKRYYNQDHDGTYGNIMTQHYMTMLVKGGENVGGLVGYACDTAISDCYAAVQVQGVSSVGGLVGKSERQIIRNSYATGNVYASGAHAGGFAGYAISLHADRVYATGIVRGANYIGGFVGTSNGGYYKNASSYGEVLNKSGKNEFAGMTAGGFVSTVGNNDVDVSTNGYLSQVGYNASGLKDEGLKQEYKFFEAQALGGLAKAASYPYDGNLLYKSFPFKMVTDNHYGDWPIQYFINNSLVYYEKYADGNYGYYSVTKLKDATQEDADADDYVWVLDSIRDETCVEDGYALLSMFYLDSVDYAVSQYDGSKWNALQNEPKTLHVSTTEYGNDKMVLLRQQGSLVFNAYEAVTTSTESPFNANYKGQPIKSSFSTNGMYLYQLPYELQNTDRYNVKNFYDRIVFSEGYAVGNLKGNDEEVGGTPVIDGETFYYCPHFAKLAANPGIGVDLEQPSYVAVRSARQLNCLGRVPYYWNNKGGVTKPITYGQEVDINFSSYTNGTKKYCGHDYNLLAFDTEYANQPIGEWNGDSSGYGSFQNDYNGNYKKIIDYCVKSNKQYVGLFGEIYKANGARGSQIRDVVMMVSDPKHVANYTSVSDPMEQNNAGYIIASFIDTSKKSGNSRPRAAVGALVGSDYTIGLTDGDASVFTVNNCVSTGYKVQYHINTPTGGQQPLGIALGGMIGYTRGNIAHSFAGNDVTLVANANLEGDTAAVCIGGFSGSTYYGTTLNCYSGGSIDVDDNNQTYWVNRLRIAGFCPGWLDAPGVSENYSREQVRYQNVYSYTTISDNVWKVRESKNAGTFNHLMPVVSRMRLIYEWRLLQGTKWHTDSTNGSTTGVRVPGFSFYLTSDKVNEQIRKSGAKEYFTRDGSNKPKTCDPATYTQLSTMSWVNENSDTGTKLAATASYTYPEEVDYAVPYAKDLEGKDYPFPAFVKDADGNYVHYGDWPLNE